MSFDSWENALWGALIVAFVGVFVSTLILIRGLVGEYKDPDSSVMIEVGARRLKKFPLLVIVGVAGELFFNTVSFVGSITLDVLHSAEVAQAKVEASTANKAAADANKLAQEARERSEGLALQVEQLRESNDQVEAENQSLRKDLTSSTAQQTQKIKELAIRGRPRDVDVDDFHRGMRGLRRENITIVELDDAEPRNFADKLVAAFRIEHFNTRTEELKATSALTGVIVCERGSNDIKLVRALKSADIAAKLMRIKAIDRPDFCDFAIDKPDAGLVTILGRKGTSPDRGTIIFVGQRPLPPQ